MQRRISSFGLGCALVGAATLLIAFCGCGVSSAKHAEAEEPGGSATVSNEAAEKPEAELAADDAEASQEDLRDVDESAGEEKKHTNRLSRETSPYLLLHAHNPVDWYPWDESAFAKAKKENKPIFLSVGYSSCYWCHVMERESFMDEEIAKYLNEHFVCIKVDREERPDVDDIYMTAVTLLNQRGGWPLSAFLTPDGKPFFGGTYWPARDGDRGSRVGFLSVAKMVATAWKEKQELIEKDAETLSAAVRDRLRGQQLVDEFVLERKIVSDAWQSLLDDFDPKWGGFGYNAINPQVPKFPEPSNLMFLIDVVKRLRADESYIDDADEAFQTLTFSLDKMAQGGIYDHLGGGFHRYSTDRYWHIPHFEKMLYDNGQLATVYAEAYALTGNEEYRQVVVGILEFVEREMTDQHGGFYAALDAETDAEEGKFYRWKKEELDEHLSEEEMALFGEIYNLSGEPNFEEEYYVPLLTKSLSEHAKERDMSLDELRAKLKPTRERLLSVRNQRKRPLTDTKILTSWNGLMIRGFADAGRVLKDEKLIARAERAASFVQENLRDDNGRLLRTHTAGEAKLNAYLDDYAFLADGLVALHRATGDDKWLDDARRLSDKQLDLFWDEDAGGFYFTSDDHEALIARAKDPVDTVIPSGNSVSAGNLLYLASKSGEDSRDSPPDYLRKANQTMHASAVYLRISPGSIPRMVTHVANYLAKHSEPAEGDELEDASEE